ncbi:MAG TPA: alanine--tRNA ligase-related protein [Ktedonobacterales bacterium]|jgi:alanyl-tRNA synthetase|nr:alanine--tRNA ligase-related protein [Ktedonobacterales bacterium]
MRFTADQLRTSFLTFLQERGHAILPSASLVAAGDSTALFTVAGMQPLMPYLLGAPHPLGRRLANAQKCLRTDDIEEVGDASHGTFLEMLGFWSLGDYWKPDSLRWTLEWFTDELGLEKERIAVTAFAGDDDAPRDDEAITVWRSLGIPDERIFPLGKEDNWWGPVAATGPCGPDSELFYDTGLPHTSEFGDVCRPGCGCGRWVEIGNNVFMEYMKHEDGSYTRLAQRNVDVGLGLERLLAMLEGATVYETDIYTEALRRLGELAPETNNLPPEREIRLRRIVVDHTRAATFLLADGVLPGNVERGYVCRRLIRRAALNAHALGVRGPSLAAIAREFIPAYRGAYPELAREEERILGELTREEQRFGRTLARGLREFERVESETRARGATILDGEDVFRLSDTFGFPAELTAELASERGLDVDLEGYEAARERQRARSRQAISSGQPTA